VTRPSDTIPEYTRSCGDVYSSVLVVGEVHAELVVDGSLVLAIGVGERAGDVFELAYQGFDLVLGVLSGSWLPALERALLRVPKRWDAAITVALRAPGRYEAGLSGEDGPARTGRSPIAAFAS
jgi:hypothetical protein